MWYKIFNVQKIWSQENVDPKESLVQKNVGPKNVGKKKCCSKKMLARKNVVQLLLLLFFFIFFWGGVPDSYFCCCLNLLVFSQIRLHPEFYLPRPSGSALKVWGGWWVV